MAIVAAVLLVTLAWSNQKATQERMEIATTAMAAAQNMQQAAAMQGATVRGLGMTRDMVARQLDRRQLALGHMVGAQVAGGRLTATSKFFRMFVQSSALGLGALLAIAGDISAGAIIASSVLLSRALQPIESIIGGWSALATARAALHRLSSVLEKIGVERTYTSFPAPKGVVEVESAGSAAVMDGRSWSAFPPGRPRQDPRHHRTQRIGQVDAWTAACRRGSANDRNGSAGRCATVRLGSR